MNSKPLVSIICTAYNLEKYIAEAIEGFLMQKTDFEYEILIGEDCSRDSTRSIIEKYIERHPGLIKMITSTHNVGHIRNHNRLIEKARGKYLAICDGDDYWTSAHKLQKQVDFLEHHSDYIICCHYSKVIDEKDNLLYVDSKPAPLTYGYSDILRWNKRETRTSTLLIRNTDDFRSLTRQNWFLNCHSNDTIFKLFATYQSGKKIYVMPEVMSIYRIHRGGIWSLANSQFKKKKMRKDFGIVLENFKYSSSQKRGLLHLYLRRYLYHDLKSGSLHQVYSTFKKLVLTFSKTGFAAAIFQEVMF